MLFHLLVQAGIQKMQLFQVWVQTTKQANYKEINHKEKTYVTNIKVFKLYLTSYFIHDL